MEEARVGKRVVDEAMVLRAGMARSVAALEAVVGCLGAVLQVGGPQCRGRGGQGDADVGGRC